MFQPAPPAVRDRERYCMIGDMLPDDLIQQIMKQSPADAQLAMRGVCAGWRRAYRWDFLAHGLLVQVEDESQKAVELIHEAPKLGVPQKKPGGMAQAIAAAATRPPGPPTPPSAGPATGHAAIAATAGVAPRPTPTPMPAALSVESPEKRARDAIHHVMQLWMALPLTLTLCGGEMRWQDAVNITPKGLSYAMVYASCTHRALGVWSARILNHWWEHSLRRLGDSLVRACADADATRRELARETFAAYAQTMATIVLKNVNKKLRSAPRGIERSTIDRTTRAQIGRVTALLRKRAVDPMTLEMMRVQDEARNKPPFNAPPFTNIVFTTKLPAGAWAFIAQNTSRPTGAKPA